MTVVDMEKSAPITKQPSKHDEARFQNECGPEDLCCCLYFVYLLFDSEFNRCGPSDARSSDKKSYCFYNNLNDDDYAAMSSSWKVPSKANDDNDEDADSDGLRTQSSSNNCSNHSPISHNSVRDVDRDQEHDHVNHDANHERDAISGDD